MLKHAGMTVAAAALSLVATLAPAQTGNQQPQMTKEQMAEMEAYMKAATPGAPHRAMAALAGTYDLKIKTWHEAGTPAIEDIGSAKRSMMLGGRVLVEEFSGSVMGQPFTGYGMRGYDNVTGEYWSTWNDSISTGLMVSKGNCDEKGNCTFTGSWNDPIKKAPVEARMISRQDGPREVFEMYGPGPDGKEMKMMEITYSKR